VARRLPFGRLRVHPNDPWVENFTDPSLALRNELEFKRDAIYVGYAFISRPWKSDDSHGWSASR
jgi:hypothetical protein